MSRYVLVLFLSLIGSLKGDFHEVLADDGHQPDPASLPRPHPIKIANIGTLPPAVDDNATPQQIVRRVKDFWQSRFAQVLPDRPDLIVLSENCDRPVHLPADREFAYYAVRGNQIRDYFSKVAKENHCYITYPAIRQLDDGTWRNSLVLLDRQGEIAGTYDKNHPTIGEIEQGKLPGTKVPIIQCDFGRVAAVICFDLNFDRLREQVKAANPDLILFSSNYHGGLMQGYWAYSCRSHFVGSIRRIAPSEIRNPLGNVIATNTDYFDYAVADVNLDCELVHLDFNQSRLKAMKKKYGRAVTISDPGLLGSVLISSSHETLGVQSMINEFEIERLDDYMERALEDRDKNVSGKSEQENAGLPNTGLSSASQWPGEPTDWHGYQRYDFQVDQRDAYVVVPKKPAQGNPWVWRARFPSFHTGADLLLLERGFHIAYINTDNMLGSPRAMDHWDAFYEVMTQRYQLNKQPALEAVSRGGLFAYRWASRNPDQVACLYADTPVCDFKSWPLGKGSGVGDAATWQRLLVQYEISEDEAIEFQQNPIDVLGPIAKAEIPLLHIISLNDHVVPPEENTYVLAKRYRELGGNIEIMEVQAGTQESNGHHFSHPNPERVANFIQQNCGLAPMTNTDQ